MQISTVQFIPKFSKTGKMPCTSFSLPAQECITGSKLAKVKGSVCHGCYALKGNYRFDNVKKPRYQNLELLADLEAFIVNMTNEIGKNEKTGYFRWHDSGDLQSFDHLKAIIAIAENLPDIKFWLPTKEKQFLNRLARENVRVPDNLVIRLSMPMINMAPQGIFKTSTVHTDKPFGFACEAYTRGGQCGSCRACWNAEIDNVSYPKH